MRKNPGKKRASDAREVRTAAGSEREHKGDQGGADAGDDELQALEEAGMDKDVEEDGEPDRDQSPLEERGPHHPLPQGRRPREGRKGPSR